MGLQLGLVDEPPPPPTFSKERTAAIEARSARASAMPLAES